MLQSCHHSAILVARMPATEASDTPPLVRLSVAEVRACHCSHAFLRPVTNRPCKHDTRISDILGEIIQPRKRCRTTASPPMVVVCERRRRVRNGQLRTFDVSAGKFGLRRRRVTRLLPLWSVLRRRSMAPWPG